MIGGMLDLPKVAWLTGVLAVAPLLQFAPPVLGPPVLGPPAPEAGAPAAPPAQPRPTAVNWSTLNTLGVLGLLGVGLRAYWSLKSNSDAWKAEQAKKEADARVEQEKLKTVTEVEREKLNTEREKNKNDLIKELQVMLATRDSERSELRDKLTHLDSVLKSMKVDYDGAIVKIDKQHDEITELREELRKKTEEIEELREQLAYYERHHARRPTAAVTKRRTRKAR